MEAERTAAIHHEKLSLAEIARRHPNEWVVLVDYDMPNMTLTDGAVYAHSPDLDSLHETIKSLRRRAVIFTGEIQSPTRWFLSHVGRTV